MIHGGSRTLHPIRYATAADGVSNTGTGRWIVVVVVEMVEDDLHHSPFLLGKIPPDGGGHHQPYLQICLDLPYLIEEQ